MNESKSSSITNAQTTSIEKAFSSSFAISFFPFFDQLSQIHSFPIASRLQFIFVTFQTTAVWLLISAPKNGFENAIKWIYQIALIISVPTKASDFKYFSSIFITISLGIFLLFFCEAMYSTRRKIIYRFLLFISTFLIDFVVPILINPVSMQIQHIIRYLLSEGLDISLVIILVFLLISYFSLLLICFIAWSFKSHSIFLPICLFSGGNINTIFLLIFSQPTFSIFGSFFYFFPKYSFYFLHIFEILVYCLIAFQFIKRPPIRLVVFSTSLSASFASIFKNILLLIFFELNAYCCLAVYILYVVLIAVIYVVMYYIQKNVIKHLSYNGMYNQCILSVKDRDEGSFPTYEEATEKFSTDKFFQISEPRAVFYAFVGLINGCDYFVDMSFVRYFLTKFQTKNFLEVTIHSYAGFKYARPLLKRLSFIYSSFPDLTFCEKFFIYQIYIIEMLSQTANTLSSAEKFSHIRASSRKDEELAKQLWLKPVISIADLEHFYHQIKINQTEWNLLISAYPNIISAREDYLRFSIECECNFQKAANIYNKIKTMECGNYFKNDQAFLHLIYCLPIYIKRKILNSNGNIIFGKKVEEDSGVNDMGTLDISDCEDFVESIISIPKLRLAFFRATKDINLKSSRTLTIFNVAWFFFSVLTFAIFYALMIHAFDEQLVDLPLMEKMRQIRSNFSVANILLLYQFNSKNDNLNFWPIYEKLDKHVPSFYVNKTNFSETIDFHSINAMNSFEGMMSAVTELSGGKFNVTALSYALFNDASKLTICLKNEVRSFYSTNLKVIITTTIMHRMLLTASNSDNWFINNSDFCSIFSSIYQTAFVYSGARVGIYDSNIDISKNYLKIYAFWGKVEPPIFFVMGLALSLVFIFGNWKEIKYFIGLIAAFDESAKNEGSKSISLRYVSDENVQSLNDTRKPIKYISLVILYVLLLVASCITSFLEFMEVAQMSKNDMNTSHWALYATTQIPIILEAFTTTLFAALLLDNPTNFTSPSQQYDYEMYYINFIDRNNENLLKEDANENSVIGNSDEFDDFYLKETCTDHNSSSSDGESNDGIYNYRCASVQQQILHLRIGLFSIISKIKDKKFDSEAKKYLTHMLNLVNSYIVPNLLRAHGFINAISYKFKNTYINVLAILLSMGILTSLLQFLCLLWLTKLFNDAFQGGILLLRRLHPIQITTYPKLLTYLCFQSQERNKEMTVTQSIMFSSLDMILYVSNDKIIEGINPSISYHLSYSQGQLLGQSLLILFEPQCQKEVLKQIDLLIKKEINTISDCPVDCISGNSKLVHCTLSVFPSTSHLVVIIRNITSEYSQRKMAEEAKEKSESLLFHILPPFIVSLINQGEKNISLTVPCATIMFIDIVRFSEYSKILTPQQILGTLSLICDGYDQRISKYETITKIKMIGDIYMCAGGLFNTKLTPQRHADEVVRFGFDALGLIEDFNFKTNNNLKVRIGVNTGGPIIAGVLGTDKRMFDIIGDPINISSRLQTTGIPGRIHVSEDTFNLIANLGYQFESRGNVFLKGKGESKTFLIVGEETSHYM